MRKDNQKWILNVIFFNSIQVNSFQTKYKSIESIEFNQIWLIDKCLFKIIHLIHLMTFRNSFQIEYKSIESIEMNQIRLNKYLFK